MKTTIFLLLLTVVFTVHSQSLKEKNRIDSIILNLQNRTHFYSIITDSILIYGDEHTSKPLGYLIQKLYYDSSEILKKVHTYRTFETYEETYYYQGDSVIKADFIRYNHEPESFYYTPEENVLTERLTESISHYLWRKYYYGTKDNQLTSSEAKLLYNSYWYYKLLGYAKEHLRRKKQKS